MANLTQAMQNPWLSMGMNILANGKGNLQPVGKAFQQSQVMMQNNQQQELLNQYRQLQMASLMKQLNTPTAPNIIKDASGKSYTIGADGKPVPFFENEQTKPDTEVGQLMQAIKAYPPGSMERKYYENRLNKLTTNAPSTSLVKVPDVNSPTGFRYESSSTASGMPAPAQKGMQVTTNPDGTMSLVMGGDNGLGTTANNEIDKKTIDATEQLARLNAIEQSFKPEYLTYQNKIMNSFVHMKDKLNSGQLSDEERQWYQGYSEFAQNALSNVNRTIKELTGQAMSISEAERIMGELPSIGTGWFDGDSPAQFEAKLKNVVRRTRQAIVRYNYAKMKGLNPAQTGIDLSSVDSLIETRGSELESQYKQKYPGAAPADIDAMVASQIKREFGL